MKKLYMLALIGLAISITIPLSAQNVGIGTNTPDASAKLDIESTTSGILIPRMTSTERTAITTPATGLMVFDNTTATFWYYDGSNWIEIDPSSDGDWVDSAGVVYNNTDSIAIGRTTATTDFHVASGKTVLFGDALSDSTGYKLIWYGQKGAFRAGFLNAPFGGYNYDRFWDYDSVGVYSFAAGRNSRAKGFGSFAFGSFGWADGSESAAFFGNAKGNNSFTFGGNSKGRGSITFEGTADDDGGIAMYGYAAGRYGVAIGGGTTGLGASSSRKDYAVAIGWNADARGQASIALGPSDAYGYNSFSTGWQNEGRGDYSAVFGYRNIAYPYASMAIGRWSKSQGDSAIWVASDPAFIIGNGTSNTARSNIVTILKNGRYGVNTETPSEYIHIKGAESVNILLEADTNNVTETDHPQLKFSQDGGGVTGYIGYSDATNHLRIANQWANADADIDFITQASTRMTIDGNGNVGIGTNAPTERLHVLGNIYAAAGDIYAGGNAGIGTTAPTERLQVAGNIYSSTGDFYAATNNGVINAGGGIMSATINYIGDNYVAPSVVAGDEDLYIQDDLELGSQGYKPGGGSWAATSDRRLKKNIQSFTDGLGAILQIRPVKYQYNDVLELPPAVKNKTYIGIIAQEIQAIAPYMVEEKMMGQEIIEDEEGNEIIVKEGTPFLTYDATALDYIIVNAIQEQQAQIEALQQENDELRALVKQFLQNGER